MISELDPLDYSRIASIFRGRKQTIPALAVLEGNYPGRAFVDSAEDPRTAYVWVRGCWAYVGGDPENFSFLHHLPDLIMHSIGPESICLNVFHHQVYAPNSSEWMAALESALQVFQPRVHFEAVHTFDAERYRGLRQPIIVPAQRRIEWLEMPAVPHVIHQNVILQDGSEKAAQMRPFKQRLKFGFGLVTDYNLIAYCGSTGFFYGNEFMIEVDTFDPADRCHGFATLVCTAMLDYCIEHGYAPLWETPETNVGSRRVAEKLGFIKQEIYPVFSFEL